MEKLNPAFIDKVSESIEIFKDVNAICNFKVNHLKSELFSKENSVVQINIEQLCQKQVTAPLLFELLNEYAFNYSQCRQLLENLNAQPGAQYISDTHRLVKDREYIIIEKFGDSITEEFSISNEELPLKITQKMALVDNSFVLPKQRNVACLDAEKISHELKLRKWRNGDFFFPLGLKGKKKLSDFFTDNKFSLIDKNNTWLLTHGEDVVWVVNHRIDDRFKICENSKKALILEYFPK